MKLYSSITSPFARKVRIAAAILALENEIEIVDTDVYSNSSYSEINPLVKIPTLTTREGQVLSNSPFILEYLNSLSVGSGAKILPFSGPERWRCLHWQSLADGLMEAAVLRRYESQRTPDRQSPQFENRQKEKIHNVLKFFETNHCELRLPWTVREISVAAALGYLDLRFPQENSLDPFPHLKEWWNEAQKRVEVKKTSAISS